VDTTKEIRKDVIQIVLEGATLMYDLDEQKEIGFMPEYARLFTYRDFTLTGFQILGEEVTGDAIVMNEKQNFALKPLT